MLYLYSLRLYRVPPTLPVDIMKGCTFLVGKSPPVLHDYSACEAYTLFRPYGLISNRTTITVVRVFNLNPRIGAHQSAARASGFIMLLQQKDCLCVVVSHLIYRCKRLLTNLTLTHKQKDCTILACASFNLCLRFAFSTLQWISHAHC